MAWFHKLHRDAGVGAKLLGDIGSGSGAGISTLPQDLTINGQTVSPTFWYEARNATTGLWTATVGEDLTGQGSGGLVGLDTPLPGLIDEAFNGDGTRHHEASDAVFADVSTEDVVLEIFFKAPPDSSLRAVSGKWDTTSGYIWLINSTDIRVQLRSGGIAVNIIDTSVLVPNTYYHALAVLDRSGSGVIYRNAIQGSAAVISSLGSIANATQKLRIGRDGSGLYTSSTDIVHTAMWKLDNWLDTHLQAALAEERNARVWGAWSSRLNAGPDQSLIRNSVASLEKQSKDGAQRLFSVGPGAPRIVKRPDIYNRYASGYQSESQHTNLFPYSDEFDNAAWSKTRATVSANTAVAPDGETTADTMAEDGTATSTHFIQESVALASSTDYTLGLFLKAVNRFWVCLQTADPAFASAVSSWFNLADGIRGTINHTNSHMRYIGNGWFWVSVTEPTVAASAGTLRVIVAEDDGDNSVSGLSQDSYYIWRAQVTATKYPVSPIRTSGAAATRLADGPLQYTGLSLPSKYTLAVDMLTDESPADADRCLAELSDGTGSNIARIYRDAATSRVNAFIPSNADVATPSDYIAGQWHEVRGTFETNNVNSYIDGSAGTADTLVTMPTGLDELNIGAQFNSASPADALVRLRLFSEPTEKNITDFGDIMSKASGYISTPAGVSVSTSYVNVGGTFTSVNLSDFTLSAAGVFTYTGANTKRFYVAGACSGAKSGGGTAQVVTAIEKNGVAVTSSESSRDVTGTAVGAWAVFADVELANGDTVNFAIKISAGTETITMDKLSAVVIEAGN